MTSVATKELIGNERFQNALARRPQRTPPIWLMRQAGRYHRHYQALRAKHSFVELCKQPELAAEVALAPVLDFDFDAAILFSDLLFPLEALGMGLEYTDRGPRLEWQLNRSTISQLRSVAEAWTDLTFQGEAVRATRDRLPDDRSLIGFVGGPWTLFVYAVEGTHKGSLTAAKKLLPLFPHFCEMIVPLLQRSIKSQLEHGAEVVMIFDTAAGELAPDLFQAVVVPQLELLTEGTSVGVPAEEPPSGEVFIGPRAESVTQSSFRSKTAAAHKWADRLGEAGAGVYKHGISTGITSRSLRLGYYSKGTQAAHLWCSTFKRGVFAGLGVDHRWDLREAFSLFPKGFLQGNFDQGLLLSDRDELQKHLNQYLAPLAGREWPGWICGLGHGVLPGTPEDNVRIFVETVREVMQ
jgi:uroporphyrinogen-III decarboxylase